MRQSLIAGVLILLTLSSCLTIVRLLVTPGTIITDDHIKGQWFDSDAKTIVVQKFMDSKFRNIFTENPKLTPADSLSITKFYVISFRENNLDYWWIAGIVKIKDHYYLNLEPEECLNSNGKDAYRLKCLSTSSIAKLEWKNNNSVMLYFLNGDYIKEIVLAGKARIKYEYDPLFGTFVITASSRELEQFLEKYGNNENLFKGGNRITLTRKT